MAKSTTVISKTRKKPGPPATGKGTPVMVRLLPPLLDALDRFIADEPDAPSRPEAVRRLLADSLTGLGLLKVEE